MQPPKHRRAPTWRVALGFPSLIMAITIMSFAGYFPKSKFLSNQILFWLQVTIWILGGTEWLKFSIKETEEKKK